MKVFVAIVLAIGSVSALGSGPYLPSGWRPQGPAFYLPSEVQKPVVSVKEAVIEETVASGSDSLQEYGPPKVVEVSQELTNQGLPDSVTDQTFLVIEAKFNEQSLTSSVAEKSQKIAVNTKSDVVEAVTLGVISVEEPTTTAPVAIEEIAIVEKSAEVIQGNSEEKSAEVIQGTSEEKSAEVLQGTTEVKFAEVFEAITDATTELVEETTTKTVALDADIAAVELVEKVESFQNVQEATEVESTEKSVVVKQEVKKSAVLEQTVQSVEEVVQVEVKAVEEGVKNIAAALVNLENEIKPEVHTEVEIKTVQENSSLEQGPVGFLEYGPPGFREYGPPTEDDLLRSTLTQEPTDNGSFENNETRKRRFSPKFRPTNNKERKQH